MTPAAKLQGHLKKRVRETGGEYRKLKWGNRRGATDTFVWWTFPRFAFIEVKVGDDELSVLQEREINRLRASQYPVYIVKTREDVDAAIAAILA